MRYDNRYSFHWIGELYTESHFDNNDDAKSYGFTYGFAMYHIIRPGCIEMRHTNRVYDINLCTDICEEGDIIYYINEPIQAPKFLGCIF